MKWGWIKTKNFFLMAIVLFVGSGRLDPGKMNVEMRLSGSLIELPKSTGVMRRFGLCKCLRRVATILV